MGFKEEKLRKLRKEIPETSPEEVHQSLTNGDSPPVLVDVREGDEYRAGHLPGAIHLPRGFLELQAEAKDIAATTATTLGI